MCSKGPGALWGGNSCSHLCGRCLGWDPMYRGHPMGTGRFGVFSLASFLRCLGGNSSLSPADFCGCKLGPRVVVCLCLRHTWLLRAQSPHGSSPFPGGSQMRGWIRGAGVGTFPSRDLAAAASQPCQELLISRAGASAAQTTHEGLSELGGRTLRGRGDSCGEP